MKRKGKEQGGDRNPLPASGGRGIALVCSVVGVFAIVNGTPAGPAKAPPEKKAIAGKAKPTTIPVGTPKMWEDRGELTPSKVYWGAASLASDPLSRLPSPPFSRFKQDSAGHNPKARITDSKGAEWTVKFGDEVQAEMATTRLAWALGFGTVEGYYIASGKIDGISAQTKLGRAKSVLKPDGSFLVAGRFKRRDKEAAPIKDARGNDLTWDFDKNPGVPPEHLSSLMLFNVMVANWDAQPKNSKVYHVRSAHGSENWYIESDLGATFARRPWKKFDLSEYWKSGFVKTVSGGYVETNYTDVIRGEVRLHRLIPIAHAQWFRKQLEKLTDDEIQAAFDTAFATDALNRAYLSGDAAQIKAAREHELSPEKRTLIAGFVAAFRAKINEFLQKVPASPHPNPSPS